MRCRGQPDPLAGRLCRLIFQARGPGPHNQLVELEDGQKLVVIHSALRPIYPRDWARWARDRQGRLF